MSETDSNSSDMFRDQPGWPTRLFLLGFDRIVRGLFRIEESGLPEAVPAPCLIVANHRRDADIPVLGAFLGRARGWKISGVLPHFVAREDLFEPGFLWHYWRSPWLALPRLISPLIPLARIMAVFKAHPIHRIPEQSLAIVLGDIRRYLGERPFGGAINRRWAARLEAAGADLSQPISWLLKREHHYAALIGGGWGHRRLNRATFREFKPVERARIAAHLAVFSAALARGEAVMVAPEGANSPDGHFQRPRAGPWRLASDAVDGLSVLPVGLAYDPSLSGRRMRVFVHAGEPFEAGDYSNRRAFDAAVARGILKATTLTGTHLAAYWVLRAAPGAPLTLAAFGDFAADMSKALSAAGLRVAPDAAAFGARRLEWFVRAGLVEKREGVHVRNARSEPAPGWGSCGALSVFLRNELASAAALAPEIAARFGLADPPYVPAIRAKSGPS
ncbi:MAG: lysophospholipid acyltransferase family protein [Candidatus Binataceae bacterium]